MSECAGGGVERCRCARETWTPKLDLDCPRVNQIRLTLLTLDRDVDVARERSLTEHVSVGVARPSQRHLLRPERARRVQKA